MAGLDECVFDEQSWQGGATSACHKSKRYDLNILLIASYLLHLFSLFC